MRRNGYTLLGFAVWKGGGWYLRRRLRARRGVIVLGLAASALGARALARARRDAG